MIAVFVLMALVAGVRRLVLYLAELRRRELERKTAMLKRRLKKMGDAARNPKVAKKVRCLHKKMHVLCQAAMGRDPDADEALTKAKDSR